MDNSLKDLEQDLEKLTPRGMSDAGIARCERLIEDLAQPQVVSVSPVGWSWKVTSVAAAITLIIGLVTGHWMGKVSEPVPVSNVIEEPVILGATFEVVDERSWLQLEGSPEVILTSAGELKEVATELDIMEETMFHRDSGNMIKLRVLTRFPVEAATSQF